MKSFRPLSRHCYEPSAKVVAPALLGHWLIRNTPNGPCGGPIVETEAYLVGDPACHGAPGPTARNRVMFGAPGHGYVYLIYGFYFCMNAVCQPRDLTNGPGKLCLAMDIDRGLDGVDLCDAGSPLFIARNPAVEEFRKERGPIVITTRIGLTKAADLALRFYLEGSAFVSQRRMQGVETRRPKTEGRKKPEGRNPKKA
jgi:DNA-3-methyladenine glycosylase